MSTIINTIQQIIRQELRLSLEGQNITIKSQANTTVEAGAQATLKGPMATVNGDAAATLQGGMVSIKGMTSFSP